MSERNKQIIMLWNSDLSAAEIAKQMDITKNIVIGVITRERESGSGLITRDKLHNPKECGKRGAGKTHKKRPGAVALKFHTMPKLFQIESKPEKQQTKIVGIPLVDLELNACRFPTSRVRDQHYFCGAPRRDRDTSYCAEHHAVSFAKRRKLSPEELQKLKSGYAMRQWLKGSNAVGMV